MLFLAFLVLFIIPTLASPAVDRRAQDGHHPHPHPRPSPADTLTTYWTGSFTSTYTTKPTNGRPTVIVETPIPTTTLFDNDSTASTYTTAQSNGTPIVVVEEPYITQTSDYTGTTTSTITKGGTIIVETPYPTITTSYTGTTTTTITSTINGKPTVVVETPCVDPQSWNWAHYASSYVDDGTVKIYSVTPFKTQTPDDSGITEFPSIDIQTATTGSTGTFYNGQNQVSTNLYFLDHTTYFKVLVSGDYTLTFTKIDNQANFWYGNSAYSGWNDDNGFVYGHLLFATSTPVTITLSGLQAGSYVPLRASLINSGGPSTLAFTVSYPNGTVVPIQDFVQRSCSQPNKTPAFPPWGQET